MRLVFRSLLARILSLHILAVAVTAVAAPLGAYFLLSAASAGYQHRILRNHAQGVSAVLRSDPGGTWRLDLPADLRTLYGREYGGFAFAVVDSGGHPLFWSSAQTANLAASAPRKMGPAYFQVRRGPIDDYGVSLPKRQGATTAWIIVAQNLEHPDVVIDDIVAGFLPQVVAFTVPLLLALLAVDVIIVRRALRPVVRASEMARDINPVRIDVRLPLMGLPREIVPLAMAVNQALDRLAAGFQAQREFTADAAHELRTPLTVLGMRIDALADRAAAAPLRADVEAMGRVVSQLLEIAELEHFAVSPEEAVDLRAVAFDVASYIAPLALAAHKSIALTGFQDSVWVNGQASALFQAVRNLAENAVLHTGAGAKIEIEVSVDGAIHVLDDGPGIAAPGAAHLFQRFHRGERSRTAGAGLGLAIVARIAAAHGGAVEVANRPQGGARFSLRLPVL